MPTYEYECLECRHRFDVFQKISEAPVSKCVKCEGKVKRLIGSGIGIIFKGSGFYVNDYKKKSGSSDRADSAGKAKNGGKAAEKTKDSDSSLNSSSSKDSNSSSSGSSSKDSDSSSNSSSSKDGNSSSNSSSSKDSGD
jgi:putative FmdB family regulatory protein